MCLRSVEVSKSLKSTVRVCMCVSFTVRQLYSKSPPHLETQMSKHSNEAWCTFQKTQIQMESGWLLTDKEIIQARQNKDPNNYKHSRSLELLKKNQKTSGSLMRDSVISKSEKWLQELHVEITASVREVELWFQFGCSVTKCCVCTDITVCHPQYCQDTDMRHNTFIQHPQNTLLIIYHQSLREQHAARARNMETGTHLE